MAAEAELTIDELARATNMTVRNVRAHQSRGLLPPPEVRARTGYYGQEHVARLRLIQEMQGAGFNLKSIERLIDASDGASEQILDFSRELLTSFATEEPEFATAEDLLSRFGGEFDAKLVKKAERQGVIRPLGDGRYEIPSPMLLRAGEELVEMGVPLDHALSVGDKVNRHLRSIAESFVDLFMKDVVGDADPPALSPEEWRRLREALERLRPLATEGVTTRFQQVMSEVVERQLGKTLRG
jgi:DNA-binding transcriptional MerR regulator